MPEVHEIVPDGDVRLIFGSEENGNCTHILVSSVVLSFGSPVFKAMLGPHFREGSTLASGSRLDLPLPEDSPEGMLVICEVMHMKAATFPAPSDDALLKVALLVDKYDCRVAMSYAMKEWIRLAGRKFTEDICLNLFMVAYLMDFPRIFSKYGRLLVTESRPGRQISPSIDIPTILYNNIQQVDQARWELLEEVLSRFEEVVEGECPDNDSLGCRCVGSCNYVSTRHYTFTSMLRKTSLWPLTRLKEQSLQSLFDALKEFPSEWTKDIAACDDPKFCKSVLMHSDRSIVSDMKEFCRSKELEVPKPCLTCAKEECMELKGSCNKWH